MARDDDKGRIRIERRYEVFLEMDLEPRDAERFDGWEKRRQPVGDIGMQVIREALRNDRLDPSRLRDSEDVEGKVRVLQVREIR